MKFVFSILLLFQATSGYVDHDVAIALFDLSYKDNEIVIDIHFDKEDLDAAITTTVEEYLFEHLKFEINTQHVPFNIKSILQEDDQHYEIKAVIRGVNQPIKDVFIKNTCLIEEIPHHSNVIYARFYDTMRGFRMHKDRVVISFDYKGEG